MFPFAIDGALRLAILQETLVSSQEQATRHQRLYYTVNCFVESFYIC